MAAFSRQESQIEGRNVLELPVSPDESNDFFASPNPPSETDDGDEEFIVEQIELLSKYAIVLQPFTLLRNVGRVDIQGVVKPRYKQYLKDVMQGDSPLDHLPKMYDALQHYAGQLDCCENVEDFKRIRATVIEKVTARMANAQERFFDHDAKIDKVGQLVKRSSPA